MLGIDARRMVRERDDSSNSRSTSSSRRSTRKRKRNSDATTTSSTTCILAKDRPCTNEPEYSAGDNDGSEAQEEGSRRQPRGPHGGSYMRDTSMPPRHPPRFISRQAAKVRKTPRLSTVQEADSSCSEGDEQLEVHLSDSSVADKPEEDPRATPRRTRKGRKLPSLDGRKTGGELDYNELGSSSSSSSMHMLGPKDEQMQRVFDKQQVVVTIERHKRRSPGTAPSPPPVVSLQRRELSPSESTDDPFMKDLKRRRSLMARFCDDLCGTVSTRCSVSAEPLRVVAAAVQCDSTQLTPAEAAPQKVATVADEAQRDAEPPTTGPVFGTSVPVHGFIASTKPAKKRNTDIEHGKQAPPKAIGKIAIDKTLQLGREDDVKTQPHLQLIHKNDRFGTIPDKISLNAGSINAKRRSSSPPVLTSSVTEDRTEQNKAVPVAQAEKAESNVTRQRRVPVAVSTAGDNLDENGVELQVKPTEQNTAGLKVLHIMKPLADNSVDKRPALTVIKDANADVGSAEIAGYKTPSQNARREGLLVDSGAAEKMQHEQADYLDIEKVGELACLLSRLIKTHDKVEPTSSVEDAITDVQSPVKRKRRSAKHSGTAHSALRTPKTHSVITGRTEESSAGTFQQFSDMIAGGVSQKSVTRKPAWPVQPNLSMAELSQEQTAVKQKPLSIDEFTGKIAEPETPELSQAVPSTELHIKQKTPAEAMRLPMNQTTESTIRKMKSKEEITPAEKWSQTTTSESTADDAKYGSDRIGGRTPEPILVGVPQDYRGWVDIGAAYAAQRPPKDGGSLGLSEMVGNTSGPRDISLTFSDVGGIRSVRRKKSSVSYTPSETTPSLSAQKPYQEYIAKQLQPPVHFAERPFAEVLASMESEMACTFKDDQTTGDQGTERDLDKSSPTSTPQASNQSAMNDEKFDKAAIESSSKGASGTGSGATVTSGDMAESSSSVASAAVTPDGQIASKAVKTTISIDSDNSSKEIPRARLTTSDSDDGSFPPSGSMSLSFVSSNSSCNAAHRLTDLADLPRLEHSVAATSHETGDGSLVLRMPLPRLTSSSAVQTESSRPPASSLTECGTQAQLLPEPGPTGRSGWPQLRKTRRREVGPRAATDRPWTDDVKRLVMLGNKHYLRQHAGRRPTAKSATTFDETQYVLFKIDDRTQPSATASPVVSETALLSTSMIGEPARESSESPLEMLLPRSTVSSGRDADTLASEDNNFEQLLKLSDLILLQHPEVGLRNFSAVHISKAAAAEGATQRQDITLEALHKEKQAPDLNGSHQIGVSEPICEKACLNSVAARISGEQLSASKEAAALTENGGKCPDTLRKPQRPSLVKSSVKAADHERRLEQEGAVSKSGAEEAPAARTTAPTVHFATSLPSQHVLFMPDCSVAIRLPGGVIRSVHPGQQAFGTVSPQGRAAIRANQKSRPLLLDTALVEPSFESIYNAILQSPPRVATTPEPSAPGDVLSPARATSSTRAVSFDDSLTTVVPLEPPPEAFKYDTADTTASSESEAPSQWRKARRHSSLCRSLTGSRLQTLPPAPAVESVEVACGAACRMMRLGGPSRLVPVLVRPGAVATKASGVENVGVDRQGVGSGRHETPTSLMSPFYSFEDTYSELSFRPESNFDRSGSTAASQRSDDHKEADEAGASRPA